MVGVAHRPHAEQFQGILEQPAGRDIKHLGQFEDVSLGERHPAGDLVGEPVAVDTDLCR